MNITLVSMTVFETQAFGGMLPATIAKRYPTLCHFGLLVRECSPELLLKIISTGTLTQTTTPQGVVVCGSYFAWQLTLPRLFADKETQHFAAAANVILSRMGVSCR